MIELIEPEWDAPASVRAFSTTRMGGSSKVPYDEFNLGQHVGDDDIQVSRNRELLADVLQLPQAPSWIRQTHSTRAIVLEEEIHRDADAAISRQAGRVSVIMTADCLPILLCNRAGTEVAAVHAGWRGLQAGIINSTLSSMQTDADELMAWIGPGISQTYFEVGNEVRTAFVESVSGSESRFTAHGKGHWLCDLGGIAEDVLSRCAVPFVTRDQGCTFRDKNRFFSYRRDGVTGRMASLIWIQPV